MMLAPATTTAPKLTGPRASSEPVPVTKNDGRMWTSSRTSFAFMRVGPDQYERAMKLAHAREMDFTGVPLKGLVFVDVDGYKTRRTLARWIDRGVAFAETLQAGLPTPLDPRGRAACGWLSPRPGLGRVRVPGRLGGRVPAPAQRRLVRLSRAVGPALRSIPRGGPRGWVDALPAAPSGASASRPAGVSGRAVARRWRSACRGLRVRAARHRHARGRASLSTWRHAQGSDGRRRAPLSIAVRPGPLGRRCARDRARLVVL